MSFRGWAAGAAAAAMAGLVVAAAAPAHAVDTSELAVFASTASGNTGDVVEINLTVSNQGTAPADPVLVITAPYATTIVAVDWGFRSGSCVDTATGDPVWSEASELECTLDGDLAPVTSFELQVSFRIDGPVDGDGQVEYHDASDPRGFDTELIVIEFTGDIVSDLAVAATSAEGKVGDVVDIVITATNHGPDTGAPGLVVKAPSGTVAVAADSGTPGVGGCSEPGFEGDDPTQWSDATELLCSWEGALMPGLSLDMTVSFRIDDAEVGDDGSVTVVDMLENDPELSNNTAPVVITVSTTGGEGGGLPVTGSPVTLLVGAGAGVLVVGGLLFVLARRRRVVLAAPDTDA